MALKMRRMTRASSKQRSAGKVDQLWTATTARRRRRFYVKRQPPQRRTLQCASRTRCAVRVSRESAVEKDGRFRSCSEDASRFRLRDSLDDAQSNSSILASILIRSTVETSTSLRRSRSIVNHSTSISSRRSIHRSCRRRRYRFAQ